MSETKHTPGPWEVFTGAGIPHPGIEGSGISIVVFGAKGERDMGVLGRTPKQAIANARLIAAAPELLDALTAIIEIGKRDLTNPKYDSYFDTARDAIAKATGEQP